jgi:hypothetical protein
MPGRRQIRQPLRGASRANFIRRRRVMVCAPDSATEP